MGREYRAGFGGVNSVLQADRGPGGPSATPPNRDFEADRPVQQVREGLGMPLGRPQLQFGRFTRPKAHEKALGCLLSLIHI